MIAVGNRASLIVLPSRTALRRFTVKGTQNFIENDDSLGRFDRSLIGSDSRLIVLVVALEERVDGILRAPGLHDTDMIGLYPSEWSIAVAAVFAL
jgi:hypothetical protein